MKPMKTQQEHVILHTDSNQAQDQTDANNSNNNNNNNTVTMLCLACLASAVTFVMFTSTRQLQLLDSVIMNHYLL